MSRQAQQAQRLVQHGLIDPKSWAAIAARQMLARLDKACRWLRGEEERNSPAAEEWNRLSSAYSQAIDGTPELFHELLVIPGPNPPGPPQIGCRREPESNG